MRIPVPSNKLVTFTLAGALLTAVVAGALAMPGGGLAQTGERPDSPVTTASADSQQVGADAPTPNPNFTPAVQTQSGYEDDEHEGDDEHEEHGEDEGDEDHEAVHGEENEDDEHDGDE